MNTLKLILLRHGRTAHNFGLRLTGWGNPGLDELGLEQAEAAAQTILAEHTVDTIYSSPLKRARETAEPFVRQTGLQPHVREGLKELNFGEVEGMTFDEVREKHPDVFTRFPSLDHPEFAWPGGETRMVFHTRVDQAIWEIIKAEAGHSNSLLIVAHGGVLAGFVSELQTGQPYDWRGFLLDNCQHYVVEVHYQDLPVNRENCTLKVTYHGQLVNMPKES